MYVLTGSGNLNGLGAVTAAEKLAFEQQLEMMRKAAKLLPNCKGVDCAKLAKGGYFNLGYFVQWPVGVLNITISRRAGTGFQFPITDFVGKDLNKPIERTFSADKLSKAQFEALVETWTVTSKSLFVGTANTPVTATVSTTIQPATIPGFPPPATTPPPAGVAPRPYLKLSLNDFVKKFPQFAVTYKGFKPTPYPTNDELTKADGVSKFINRSGYLILKDAFDGKAAINKLYSLWACGKWCRACPDPAAGWPDGEPFCAEPIELETKDFTWGVYARMNSTTSVTIILKRLPKTTWDKFQEGLEWLGRQIDKALDFVCQSYASPEGQTVNSVGQSSPNPAVRVSAMWTSEVLSTACKRRIAAAAPVEPISVEEPLPDQAATVPWWQTTGAKVAILVGATAATGTMIAVAARRRAR